MNTTQIRELNVAELDLVGGAARIAIKLPGKVSVQLNTETGCWSVWLDKKEVYYGGGPDC